MCERFDELGYELRRESDVLYLALNRPALHNAFDERLIAELSSLFAGLAKDKLLRSLVITGNGKSFSAGADLNWMRRAAFHPYDRNVEDAMALELMFRRLDSLPFPVIARIHGAAIGGGLGLVACSDIAIASDKAVFAASEVRLGIVPAVISRYVLRSIGVRQARRYLLTAERMNAEIALKVGLVHEIVEEHVLDERIQAIIDCVKKGGCEAIAETKMLIREVPDLDLQKSGSYCAQSIARRRASAEGKEGIQAFLDKRAPNWLD